jgi:signal transduction histidine kinase
VALGIREAEYRALRVSVLSLWTRELGQLETEHIEDMIRFNDAINHSLAESVAEFNGSVEAAKEMFLAILDHDLRSPLGAIYGSAHLMLDRCTLEEGDRSLTSRIATSPKRTVALVGDLLDFTRSRLGGGIPLVRQEMELGNSFAKWSMSTPRLTQPTGSRCARQKSRTASGTARGSARR